MCDSHIERCLVDSPYERCHGYAAGRLYGKSCDKINLFAALTLDEASHAGSTS